MNMNVNDDFNLKAVAHIGELAWLASPSAGVMRKPLDRVGDEVARATSIVQFAPDSVFEPHEHPEGEEIMVLDGEFSDDTGDYPAGTYIRNPPGSGHAPKSQKGCTLFVKLRQFHPNDSSTVRIDTNKAPWYQGMVAGLTVMPLHEFDGVNTALVRWAPNTIFNPHVHPGGEEIFVLQGVFHDEHGSYPAGSWIRSPRYSKHAPYTKAEGALIYVKTGHLG